ncbi:MAG: alanyl-tRNA editing protein [Nitrososphaerota archaeon]|nr:alanyl-tRNA editing protein [Candidatus Calditenuaceae archaeon]MDW8072696.1 alanyl-tRNA editing protein [Nitrososphaerota archaeon]
MNLSTIASGLQPTNRLYLSDSYLKSTETTLLRYVPETRKSGYIVTRDTIMHPKGGAQPSDTGSIESPSFRATVKKVLEHSGVVIHYCEVTDGAPTLEGEKVSMSIDWEKRYLVMRLHTAGHIVDHAVLNEVGHDLLSSRAFHGPPESFVEYMGKINRIDLDLLAEVSNEIVRASKRVYPVWVSREELWRVVSGAPNMERLPSLETYRVIVVEGVNAIPCGGTHVANTGEVGRIVITGVKELERGFRVIYNVTE